MGKTQISRRTFLAGSMVSAGAIVAGLSACGSSSSSSSASASGSEFVGGGTITAGIAYATSNAYTPVGVSAAAVMAAYCHCCEALYDLDYANGNTPYAALAAGDPVKVSDTEFTIDLRADAKYYDGSAVTAADVKNAIEVEMANDTYKAFLKRSSNNRQGRQAYLELPCRRPAETAFGFVPCVPCRYSAVRS